MKACRHLPQMAAAPISLPRPAGMRMAACELHQRCCIFACCVTMAVAVGKHSSRTRREGVVARGVFLPALHTCLPELRASVCQLSNRGAWSLSGNAAG